jgi:two-component system, cell cycle response regulator CpdR
MSALGGAVVCGMLPKMGMQASNRGSRRKYLIRNKAEVFAFQPERRKFIRFGSPMSRVALVVDDDPAVLELLAEMLGDLGCEVITQQDATEALVTLEQDQRIEILLTDINMPGIAGYELADRAKRLRPGVKPILVSGRETDGYGYPLLRKPFLQNDLVRVIRETTGLG